VDSSTLRVSKQDEQFKLLSDQFNFTTYQQFNDHAPYNHQLLLDFNIYCYNVNHQLTSKGIQLPQILLV
jgi:hypothetical protein